MTRDEYRQAIRDYFKSPGWDVGSQQMNFPTMLSSVALALFVKEDITSNLAKETIRRMKQLKETGITDP